MNRARIVKIKSLQDMGWVRGTYFTIEVWIDPTLYDLENLDNEAFEDLKDEIEAKLQAFCASVIVRPGVEFDL